MPRTASAPANEPHDGWAVYGRLLGYVLPYWPIFAVSLGGYALYGATQASLAALMEYLPVAFGEADEVDGLLSRIYPISSPEQLRQTLPLFLVAMAFTRGIGSYLGGYYITLVGRNLVHDIRQDLFARVESLPVGYFLHRGSSGIISMLTYNVEQITAAATGAIQTLVREGLTITALLLFLFSKNWKLTLAFLLIAPLIGSVVSLASALLRRYSRRIQTSMGNVAQVAGETVRGIAEVKTYGAQDYEQNRFRRASAANLRQSLKLARVTEISSPLIQVITFCALALLFWIGLSPALSESMDTGDFLAYLAAAAMLARPLRQLTAINTNLQKGIAAAQSIFAVLDEPPEPDHGQRSLVRARGELTFRSLSFRYPDTDTAVLKDIDLHLQPGQTLALVGRSGAGKTTLASLVVRHNPPPPRTLFLDGQPIEDYRLADLRRQVAVVSQHILLYEDSIRANIAYGELADRSEAQIIAAAKSAHALEFIESLPHGFATRLGEGGLSLSGGQRQRIALARAFLKDAPILILDEATAALDNESERHIQQALAAITANRTTLVIAHRLSTIENADLIAVLEQGKIVETGSHAALLARGGAYAQLHRTALNAS
ncbi:MAG: lipid A export permease/ATP-binding protein MsbA [Cellvibrionales bacterium]|nr:lipid A export permease/ATP-binding protein MsbA [Cellvibrionales bacterium]